MATFRRIMSFESDWDDEGMLSGGSFAIVVEARSEWVAGRSMNHSINHSNGLKCLIPLSATDPQAEVRSIEFDESRHMSPNYAAATIAYSRSQPT